MLELSLFILAILLLIASSAFFSGSETALTAASKARVHRLSNTGSGATQKKARAIEQLWDEPEPTLGAILLGNNLVNILASALATSLFIRLFGPAGVVYATLVMTISVVLFAEILPKTIALRRPDDIAMRIIRPLRFVTKCIRPFSDLIQFLVSLITRPFGKNISENDKEQEAEEALLGAIDLHTSEVSEGKSEEDLEARNMMRSILDLDDVAVSEIMSHRKTVETVGLEQPIEALVQQVLKSPFTRLPLWKGEPDNIIGVLHAKDVLRAVQGKDLNSVDIESIARPPWFVPENTILLDQLRQFRGRREHFALVVDEYGGLEGVVTLEDILEEIVGEIADEQDKPVEGLFPQADGSVVVNGRVTIRDLNRRFDWQLPDDKASTIAGLVLYESAEIPKIGQVFDFYGFRIKILKKQHHQMTSLSLRKLLD